MIGCSHKSLKRESAAHSNIVSLGISLAKVIVESTSLVDANEIYLYCGVNFQGWWRRMMIYVI